MADTIASLFIIFVLFVIGYGCVKATLAREWRK